MKIFNFKQFLNESSDGITVGENDENNKIPGIKDALSIVEQGEGENGGKLYPDHEKYDPDIHKFKTKTEAIKYVKGILDMFHGMPENIPVYRAVYASNKEVNLDPYEIGESWSWELQSAKSFGSHNQSNKIISGFVKKGNVAWTITLLSYHLFSGDHEDTEDELNIPAGNKITNVKVDSFKTASKRIIESREFSFIMDEEEIDFKDLPRYLLHIASPNHRRIILEKGFVPRLPGKKWKLLGVDFDASKTYWKKPSFFATLFKDNVDAYDIKNIRNYVFPLASIGDEVEMGPDDFIEHYTLQNPPNKNIDNEEWAEEVNTAYNKYLLQNSIFDIWMIDTRLIPDVQWYIDQPHEEEKSIYTHEKIPANAIELLVPSNKPMFKVLQESVDERPVISYDCDGVLHKSVSGFDPIYWDQPEKWEPFLEIHEQIKKDALTHKIIVVTARHPITNVFIQEFINMHNLPIEEIYATNNFSKIPVLEKYNVEKHYDDNEELKIPLEIAGIEFVLVKPTEGTMIIEKEISSQEAHNDNDALQTVIDGKRNLAFLVYSTKDEEKELAKLDKLELKYLKVPSNPKFAYVIYREGSEKEANELVQVAEKYKGYLSNKASAEDTRKIGKLLSYKDSDVEEFIKNGNRISKKKELFYKKFTITFKNEKFFIADNTLEAFINRLKKIDPYLKYDKSKNGKIDHGRLIYIESFSLSQQNIKDLILSFTTRYDHLSMTVVVSK